MNHAQWLDDVLSLAVHSASGHSEIEPGRETLPETLAAGLAETVLRALEYPGAEIALVRRAFLECHTLTPFTFFQLVGRGTHDRDVAAFLARAEQVELQYGRMSWDRDLIAQDLAAERRGRVLPRATGAPRLFIS